MNRPEANLPTPTWPEDIYRSLVDLDIRQLAYVPDHGYETIIGNCRKNERMHDVLLTTEQEGVGVLAGAWLGGQRGVLMMQSTGVGNCLNALALTQACRFPLLMICTMRGEWGETNPWQNPMGKAVVDTLKLQQFYVYPVGRAEDVRETVLAAGSIVFNSSVPAAVMISQRVLGIVEF